MAERNSLEYEAEIEKRTRRDHADVVRVCDDAFDHVGNGFNLLGGEMKREPVKDETLRFAALAFNALRWAREKLLKGYYGLSISDSRIEFDSWLNGLYLNYYPERLADWQKFETRPQPKDMRKLVVARSGLDEATAAQWRKALNEFYGGGKSRFSGLSTFSHASGDAIDVLIGPSNSEGQFTLRLGGDFDEDLLRLAAHNFCMAAQLVSSLFIFLSPESADYVRAHELVVDEYTAYVRRFERPTGQN